MTALLAAGAAVRTADVGGTHPRVALQVHPADQADWVTGAALIPGAPAGTRAAPAGLSVSARQAAPAAAGGPAGVQATGAALANAATGQVLWSVGLNTERPIGGAIGIKTGDTKAPATACCSRRAGTA